MGEWDGHAELAAARAAPPARLGGGTARRCGKPNCRCADGQQLHEAPALSYSDRGRTKIVLLDDGDVAAVTAAVDRYRAAAAELDAAAGAGLAALDFRVAGQRAAGRRRRGR